MTTKVVNTITTVDTHTNTSTIATTSSPQSKGTSKPVIPVAPLLPVEYQQDKSVVKSAVKKNVASDITAEDRGNNDTDNEEIITDCKQKTVAYIIIIKYFLRWFWAISRAISGWTQFIWAAK